jgi:hypothetical protein
LNNGEHTLIPVTTKMIHSAVTKEFKRFVLKDGCPLHMVKFVGAVSKALLRKLLNIIQIKIYLTLKV